MSPVLPFSREASPRSVARSAGARFLVVWFPLFSLERCGYCNDDLVVMTAFQRNAMRVIAMTQVAYEAGIREGMSLSEARALEPGLVAELWQPEEEARDWEALCEVCRQYSDRVQRGEPSHLIFEISTVSHLFGGESALLQTVADQMASLGHHCMLAIAERIFTIDLRTRTSA